MKICEILIVEDDENTLDSWQRDIRDFNRRSDAPFRLNATFAVTKREALAVISRLKIHCAVVDLRLPEGNTDGSTGHPLGNEVLHKLIEQVGIPAVVYSGYEGETSAAVHSSNVRVIRKEGGAAAGILDLFASQADLMDAMEAARTQIATETARLFNRSIWPRWEKRWSKELDKEMIAGVIARQTAAHIAESLAASPLTHHPDEFYIVPSMYAERLDTGDLLEIDDQVHIVLTPRCNLANKVPSHLLLAVCEPMPIWSEWKELLSGSGRQQERASRELRSHATQGHQIASHFLPPLDGKGPWLVDFQEVRTLNTEELPSLIPKRFASVAPQFVPNLVQRYSSYLGRIGQPDLGAEILLDICRSR